MGNYWVNVETVDKIICKIEIYKNMTFHCYSFYFCIDSLIIFLLDTLTLFRMATFWHEPWAALTMPILIRVKGKKTMREKLF